MYAINVNHVDTIRHVHWHLPCCCQDIGVSSDLRLMSSWYISCSEKVCVAQSSDFAYQKSQLHIAVQTQFFFHVINLRQSYINEHREEHTSTAKTFAKRILLTACICHSNAHRLATSHEIVYRHISIAILIAPSPAILWVVLGT